MTIKLFTAAIVLSSLAAFTGCGKSNKNSSENSIPAGASAAMNNNTGAWAPVTAQVIDYDGNSKLQCSPGQSVYQIFLKTGLEIDVKQAAIGRDCVTTVQHVGFVCTPQGQASTLQATVDGKVMGGGDLGVYQNLNDCQGYAAALGNKKPS
jgi:hypothetical protein